MTALEQYFGSLSDKRVGVIGAGVSNMPLIRRLRAAGVRVAVHDRKTPTELGDGYATLATLGVDFVLGEHYLDVLDEDVIFRTPGVHPRFLEQARANGSEITSEMELFFAVCPCPIIGITGSDGKTTTTTLVCEILRHAGYTVHLGGNIGTPLLPRVDLMTPDDLAVVELSSFQLMDMKRSPHIAAITNLTPNHLDYHKDFDEYVQAKTTIYRNQKEGDRLVLNLDDEVTRTLHASGNLFCTSKNWELANGVFLKDDVIYIAENGERRVLMPAADIRIPGAHNVYNMMMAAAIVQGYASDDDIRAVATSFGGVEHRIEFVREKEGVKYYNDSIASSPTRTIAGLNSFQQKVILIAGGYDKHIPYDVLGGPICEHVKALILTGATAPKIRDCVLAAEGEHPPILETEDLEAAVREAARIAQAGDIVIMSPASASFDRFKNFMERGNLFKALVNAL
ncbi:MAG: UDP-N-acetylmuramoyl-L-alanine--D-glutamate ligase [Agathobaculum sp.]|jgi:UDP-N-acetylmuramoylalanine--D-glutamate ligase|uniref:UDP-N-acetylmuramoyl-L-alanine--D-glutamate ligase n=1 Tax=Agathobaculum sp. TaxID=2048138 RepID=UPI003D8ACE93